VAQEIEPSGASLAAYAAGRGTVAPHLTTELGVRWDHQTYTSDGQWSPRFNLVWDASARDGVRLALGIYTQSVRIHELRIEDGETDYRPAESSRQLDLTYTHRLAGGSTFRFDAYLHRLSHVLPRYENLNKPIEIFPEAEPDRVLVAPERADLEGVEVSIASDPQARLAWSSSYTWSRAEDVIDGMAVPRSWDQPHAFKLLASYEWKRGWFAGVNGTIHTGWPTTPIVAQVVVEDDGSTTIEPVPGERNSARLPAYARLDLKAGRKLDTRRGTLRVELSVLNTTDRDNACCIDEVVFVERPNGDIDTEVTYDSWLGITPVLQLLWQF
jgi:outer membrane receptor protein involved in Fe transport